jgi:hypothetical protein
MQDVFLNGLMSLAAPPQPYVMGLKLRPFCLGHSILFEAIESPFIVGGSVGLPDLSIAAWICSKTYEDGSAALLSADPSTSKAFKAWGRKWGKRGDFITELEAFKVYVDHYAAAPARWESEESKSKVPWQWAVLNALSGGIANPDLHAKILNMPLNSAICQASSIGAANGDESLMTEEEERAIDELSRIAGGQIDV